MVDNAREARLLLKTLNENSTSGRSATAPQIAEAATLCSAMKRDTDPLSPMYANLLYVESQLLAHSDMNKQLVVLREAVALGEGAAGMKGSKVQRNRESVLASIEESLGVEKQPPTAEEVALKVAEEDRKRESRRKKQQARRKRDRKYEAIESSLAELYPATTSLFNSYLNSTLCGSCASPRIDWSTVPTCLHPVFETQAEVRAERKSWQLESLAYILSTFPSYPPLHIVDFGAGSGNSSLVLAHLHPEHSFTLIEMKPNKSVDMIQSRANEAGLLNVNTFHGNFLDYPHTFDLGLAIHLCGEATDLCMERCFNYCASFVIVPCCVGKIASVVESQLSCQSGDADVVTLTYPRSKWLKDGMETDMYLNCTRSADYSEKVGTNRGQMSKKLIDMDRAKAAEERGYVVQVGKLEPVECTAKHDVIVGRIKSPLLT